MGHLRPKVLLCRGVSRKWRRQFDLASCGLPVNFLEQARQYKVVGLLESGEVGEMEAGDIVVGEVVQLFVSAVCGLPVSVKDIALFGEESRVSAPLFDENKEVGESRIGCSRRITASTLVLFRYLEADSSDPCKSKPAGISPNLSKSSI